MRRETSAPPPRPAVVSDPPAVAPATARGTPPERAQGPDPALVAGWIRAAQGGDGEAFADLVRAYGGIVTRVIGRLVSDPDDRDDLVQETFVRAFTGIQSFKLGRDFRPWILTIAVNLARDRWRRRSSAPPTVSLANEAGEPIQLPSPEPSAESAAVGEELRERAEEAFQRLDPEARTVLWLRVREGLDYREMAQVLGIPRGTVMSRLSRARQALRAELERGPGDRSR